MMSKPFLILFVGLLSSAAWSDTLTIGVEEMDYLPVSSGEGGNYRGYSRELLDTFGAKYGHTFTYKPMPVARLFEEMFIKKTLDLKYPDDPHWVADRKKGLSITYSKKIVGVTDGLLVLPANQGKGRPVTKIVTIRGFTPYPYLDQIKAGKITLTEVNTAKAAIAMVAAGRVDGVYLGVMAANYIMDEGTNKSRVLIYDDKLPKGVNSYSMSTLSRPDVIKQMDEFLVKFKDTVTQLKTKYKIVE